MLNIVVPGTVLSSSIYRNQKERWGPEFAVDGLWSKANESIFLSKKEDFPWIQWHLPMKTKIIAIVISNANIAAQAYSLKGQMWGSLLRGNDPPTGRSNYEESWGYIPTLSFERNLINNSVIECDDNNDCIDSNICDFEQFPKGVPLRVLKTIFYQ